MLTLLKNIERFNKRYNKKRGSAMLMVLMTMAIIIVVGSSMLFVTLSSFSNSIADTHQERAYNAALTVSDTLKNSGNLNSIITAYADKLEKSEDVVLKFSPTNELDGNQPVDYMVVNGVKVYVTLSRAKNTTKFDKVLVDIKGVKGSQESTVSFEVNSVPSVDSTTIKDTFGNAFVMSNNMGSEVTSPYQIYKRIEGDVSLNCFENAADGKRVMKTRVFNPIVLEGVTGSIYANGDLIIGAPNNMLRVQGNVYVDGNLTIRGLALGVNLPALVKKYYAKKYIHYYTYAHATIGSIINPYSESTLVDRNSGTFLLGEAMYEKLSDGTFRPIQAYDKLTHYTLLDLATEDATEYSFWTKNYGENNKDGNYTWEKVTITLRVKDSNGNFQIIDADYNQNGINNAQYLGASMYEYTPDGSEPTDEGTPIMQFPQGGNIYCSGDIVFDTVNYGNVFTYDAGIFNLGNTDNEQEQQDKDDNDDDDLTQNAIDKINAWFKEHFNIDNINPEFEYYSLAYNLDGKGDGRIPVHTKIEGDVYCQGRMIIAPDTRPSYKDYKKDEKLDISPDFSNLDKYISTKVLNSDNFVLNNSQKFLTQIINKWEQITGGKWGNSSVVDMIIVQKLKDNKVDHKINNLFDKLTKDGYSIYLGNDYKEFVEKYYDAEKKEWVEYNDIVRFRTPKFSENSNLYIQNDPIRKGMGDTAIEKSEIYATDDTLRVVTNTDKINDEDRKESVVGDIAYTAALTVRYCEISVNNVYCDGAISVLESKIPGHENSAAVNVKGQYLCSFEVKNELKKVSIKDILNNKGLTDSDILEKYFGVTNSENNFKFEGKWNSEITYTHGKGKKQIDITYQRQVIVLRATLELKETAHWTNNPVYDKYNPSALNFLKHDEHHSKIVNHWNLSDFNSNWQYYADLMYVVDETKTWKGKNTPSQEVLNANNLKGKVMNRYGEEVTDLSTYKDVENLVTLIEKDIDKIKDDVNYINTAFLSSIDNDAYRATTYNTFVNNGKIKSFNDQPIPEATFNNKQEKCTWGIKRDCFLVDVSATYEYSAMQSEVMSTNLIQESVHNDYDSVLKIEGENILGSAFLNSKQLIAMFSDRSNDFGGIVNGEMVKGRAIKGGSLKEGETFDALIKGTKAFDENGKHKTYGMYLAKDKKYAKVNNQALVQAIFDEITSSEFATVVEANTDQKKAKANIKKMLNDLRNEGQLNEYNAFDIYGSVNDYDKILGVTSGKAVKDYICRNGETLTKKYLKTSFSKPNTNDVMTYLQTLTFPNADPEKWWNIGRWYYVEHSNDVEDDNRLRLMDFYDKNAKDTGAHLRADSTFAIDEKYNQTFDVSSGTEIQGFKRVALRSEVQYTIDQNTYFNFKESMTQVVFAASTDGMSQRTRMNFLIDTSKKDIYIFFHTKALDKTKDKKEQTRFLFQKCSFQVTGKNNAYLMLIDDTSFAANAFTLEISNTLGENKTDEKVGTHFKSNTYQKYVAKFKEHGREDVSAWDLGELTNAMQLNALAEGNPTKVGFMFIIGMGRNYVKFGRGGSVNALVYIPEGKYSNESTGLLNIIPIAGSGNNEASIVAKDIYIGGSNRGKLIFSSYDVSQTGSKNNSSAGIAMDGLINPDTVTHGTKWVAGNYYYG